MATQKYRNNAKSTLNGAITNVATTCIIASPGSFPTSGDFPIIIDNEICKVTNVVGAVFTIVRAQEGTTAAAHANGAAVNYALTAAAIDAMRAETIQTGTLASLPVFERVGRMYRPTDAIYDFIDTGLAWDPYLRAPKAILIPTDFTWVNQGTATVTTAGGGEFMRVLGGGTGDNVRARVRAVPAAPYTRTGCFIPMLPPGPNGYPLMGIALYDGTKFITFAVQWRADASGAENIRGRHMLISRWNTITSWNTDTIHNPASYGHPIWLRISDDNVNRRFSFSFDGYEFITIATELRTAHLTPTQIGYFINNVGCTNDLGIRLVSWE